VYVLLAAAGPPIGGPKLWNTARISVPASVCAAPFLCALTPRACAAGYASTAGERWISARWGRPQDPQARGARCRYFVTRTEAASEILLHFYSFHLRHISVYYIGIYYLPSIPRAPAPSAECTGADPVCHWLAAHVRRAALGCRAQASGGSKVANWLAEQVRRLRECC
jgi:hypothetical protein